MANKAAKEMIFKPPNCIKIITIICPLNERTVEMSIKLKPVTQLALMLVNSAVTKSKASAPAVISGSIKSVVPKAMRMIKLMINRDGGLKLKSGKRSPTFPNSKKTMIIT